MEGSLGVIRADYTGPGCRRKCRFAAVPQLEELGKRGLQGGGVGGFCVVGLKAPPFRRSHWVANRIIGNLSVFAQSSPSSRPGRLPTTPGWEGDEPTTRGMLRLRLEPG